MLEGTGAIPETLVVAIEYVTMMIKTNTAWRADAIGCWDRLAIWGDSHTPTAERALVICSTRTSKAKDNPDVALFVMACPKGILMIVAVDTPSIPKCFEDVSATLAVTILDTGNFRALS